MKTTINGFVLGLAIAGVSFAGMEDAKVINNATIAVNAANTNYVFVRGELAAVMVKISDTKSIHPVVTNTVTVTTDEGVTLFSKACTGTNLYPIVSPAYTTAGDVSILAIGSTNKVAIPVVSKVTVKTTGENTLATNTATVQLLWRD